MVNVELVYIPVDQQAIHLHLTVPVGATVAEVLQRSALLQSHPEIKDMPVGLYAKLVTLDTVVKSGDRIEIYRPLMIDPKEKRRQRARQKK
jgi:putative ubiquitin-RnfH superfamily antitoxin RatB of RatAB toxin-antitoxin module